MWLRVLVSNFAQLCFYGYLQSVQHLLFTLLQRNFINTRIYSKTFYWSHQGLPNHPHPSGVLNKYTYETHALDRTIMKVNQYNSALYTGQLLPSNYYENFSAKKKIKTGRVSCRSANSVSRISCKCNEVRVRGQSRTETLRTARLKRLKRYRPAGRDVHLVLQIHYNICRLGTAYVETCTSVLIDGPPGVWMEFLFPSPPPDCYPVRRFSLTRVSHTWRQYLEYYGRGPRVYYLRTTLPLVIVYTRTHIYIYSYICYIGPSVLFRRCSQHQSGIEFPVCYMRACTWAMFVFCRFFLARVRPRATTVLYRTNIRIRQSRRVLCCVRRMKSKRNAPGIIIIVRAAR